MPPPPPPPIGLANLSGGGIPPPLPPIGLPGIGGPPPIGNLFGQNKQKTKTKPRVPMRGLMWQGISKQNDIKDSIFEKVDENKIQIDIDSLEEDFKEKTIEKKDDDKKKVVKIEKKSLIEPKRGKMFDIFLAKLKIDGGELAMSLMTCDQGFLKLEILELLVPIVPTEEELKICQAYKGDKELLANPERLILALGVVKGYANRIKALHFVYLSKDLLEDLKGKLEALLKTWRNVLEDERIIKLFQYVLAYGNYLNGVSNRGGMYGFAFDGLERVVDCRSTKNQKRNLLNYILDNIEKNEGKSLIEDTFPLIEFETLSKIPINQLELDLSEIKKGLKFMDLAINSYTGDSNDRIAEMLKRPYEEISSQCSVLEHKIKELADIYIKIMKYLCEDNKEGSDKTGKKLMYMWSNCLTWKKEINRRRRDEERKRLIEEKKKKQMALPIELKNPVKRATDNLKKENMNTFKGGDPDDLIKGLHKMRKEKSIVF